MPFPKVSQEKVQLEEDIIAVFVRRTRSLSDFPSDYQTKLRDSYRFSAWRYRTNKPIIAMRTRDTLDIV